MDSPGSTRSLMIRLFAGEGQVPLRFAVHWPLREEIRDRSGLAIGLAYALAFGTLNAIVGVPVIFAYFSAFLFSAYITFVSSVPWHLRLVRRPTAASILLLNGGLSMLLGLAAFYAILVVCGAAIYGFWQMVAYSNNLVRHTGWGAAAAITGFPIALGHLGSRQARRDRARRLRLERLAEQAEIIALRAQINPHFFFNALNTIAALIPVRPHDAERAVELLAESLRPVLMRDQPMVQALSVEFEVARAYAQIEELRFGDRLRVAFDLPNELADAEVPSLSLQPLLENAIRHGAGRDRGIHCVSVTAYRKERGIEVEVLDGPEGAATADGTPAEVREGHALHNIGRRLSAIFGPAARLDVRIAENGARAAMFVPSSGPTPLAAAAIATSAAPMLAAPREA